MKPKTVAEINLNHLLHNIHAIQKQVFPAKVIPVVKADAYGHGAVPVARRLEKEGIEMFAVAQFKEAMELRDSGITRPILIFGRLFPGEISEALKANFRISVFGKEDLVWIEKANESLPAYVHVNVETGMGRVGLILDQEPDFFDYLGASKCCIWEGCYSHFSTSDEMDKTYANLQLQRFKKILSTLKQQKVRPGMIHMANSGAILDISESYFDVVRAGILMYGHLPSPDTTGSIQPKQVMTLKTYVGHIRDMPAGHAISYGRRWTTPKATKIAVLPIGYADGIRRGLTNIGDVLIRGKRYHMVGTVTMDQIMIDVGDDPIKSGDEVILWGDSQQGSILVAEVAEKIGTIPYEITCGVSKRIKREYIEE
ncbi:alanine racemase [Thermodesulfobacteriota bacterium]